MQIQEIVPVVRTVVDMVSYLAAGATIMATIIVRMTPSKKDDEAVLALGGKVWTAIMWLPTIGINPQTKALQEAYQEQKAELEKLKAQVAAVPEAKAAGQA